MKKQCMTHWRGRRCGRRRAGACRQALREFCGPEFVVLLVEAVNKYECHTLGELLPFGFGPENLGA